MIPRTLVQNSGGNAIRVLTELRVRSSYCYSLLSLTFLPLQAKHANGEHSWGINGDTSKIVDMKEYGLYESASVKVRIFLLHFHSVLISSWKIQTFKTAIEAARVLLRVEDVVQATRKDRERESAAPVAGPEDMPES